MTSCFKKILISALFLSVSAFAEDEAFFSQLRELANQSPQRALDFIEKEKNRQFTKNEAKIILFEKAYLTFQLKKYEDSTKLFTDYLNTHNGLSEYAYFYRGLAFKEIKKFNEAQKDFYQVLGMSPNLKLSNEASNLIGTIYIDKKDFKGAKKHLSKLERRTRGTEQHPEILFNLAVTENGLNNRRDECKRLRKLYTRYPEHSLVREWGPILSENKLNGREISCVASISDFKTRIKYLVLSGNAERASKEVEIIRNKIKKSDLYQADVVLAQFNIQTGEVVSALQLLRPYFQKHKNDVNYLNLIGTAAARAGEYNLAVSTLYKVFKLHPKSKQGRNALFQSAFLSYQFQDYDGASRRFQEFIRLYPRTSLASDSKWQLAWIKYLKSNYTGAYLAFKSLINKRNKNDRITYWMAMSLLKSEKKEQARKLFLELTEDSHLGYYSIAAESRLKTLPLAENSTPPPLPQRQTSVSTIRSISRITASVFESPIVEPEFGQTEDESKEGIEVSSVKDSSQVDYEVDAESEGKKDADAENSDDESVATVDETKEDASDLAKSDDAKKFKTIIFPKKSWMQRFDSAKELNLLGLSEWARWDLYDIERKTKNQAYLEVLMKEYSNIGQYHRSSYIGQVYFSAKREKVEVEEARMLWEFAYPLAYQDHVQKYSDKFGVPKEFIWAIMRAESTFKKDAVSPVGAIGLMQIMPFTAEKIANTLGDSNFKSASLFDSEYSIKIGSRYLKRLLEKFNSVIPLAAAAYNAGPHRVKNWLITFGHLNTDEFIEHIPFLETRNYVKKVVSNAYVYSKLYGKPDDLFPYLSSSVPILASREYSYKESWDDL